MIRYSFCILMSISKIWLIVVYRSAICLRVKSMSLRSYDELMEKTYCLNVDLLTNFHVLVLDGIF